MQSGRTVIEMKPLIALLSILMVFAGLTASTDNASFLKWNYRRQLEKLEEQSKETVRFVVMPDRTGGEREGIFQKALQAVSLLKPDVVITVGDHIGGYTTDEPELRNQWEEFLSLIEPLSLPYFCTPGNHDNLNSVQKELWKENFGQPFFHFNCRGFLFLSLNSQDEPKNPEFQTDMGVDQLAYARQVLAKNPDAQWTFVFMHQPLWWMTPLNGERATFFRIEVTEP